MTDGEGQIWTLALLLALLSLVCIGGVAPVLPEVHRQVVDVHGWMTSGRFTDLFAIAQASPGPNFLVISLIGLDVGGVPGALIATLAISGPTIALAYGVGLIWRRFSQARWRRAIQAGLVPLSIGLVCATAYIIAKAAVTGPIAVALTLVTAVALYSTRLHPILFLGVGAILGFVGWL
jgi:chromate transporter